MRELEKTLDDLFQEIEDIRQTGISDRGYYDELCVKYDRLNAKLMSKTIAVDEIEWDESTPCPKCGCRVLKLMYATIYTGKGRYKEYYDSVTIIECPYCDYEKQEPVK